MTVRGTDGSIDREENEAFVEYLTHAESFPPGIPRDVLVDLSANLEALLDWFATESKAQTPSWAFKTAALR